MLEQIERFNKNPLQIFLYELTATIKTTTAYMSNDFGMDMNEIAAESDAGIDESKMSSS